jgi:hypothetical protein
MIPQISPLAAEKAIAADSGYWLATESCTLVDRLYGFETWRRLLHIGGVSIV